MKIQRIYLISLVSEATLYLGSFLRLSDFSFASYNILNYHQLANYLSLMIKNLFSLALAFLVLSATSKQIVKFTISSYILPNKQLEMELDVVVPRTPNSYPTVLYLTGLSGLLPSYFQSDLIDSVAEEGFAWFTISSLHSPDPTKITNSLEKVVEWLNDNIQQVLNNRVPGVIADLNQFVLIGHSAGGHVTTQYLNTTCGNVKLQVLLDAVDGSNPLSKHPQYIITPGQFLPYATPVLVMATELDSKSNIKLDPPCAPLNLSNLRFYDAMRGPKWFLNVSKYGHGDFLNNEYREAATVMCATCRKDCNFGQYRTVVKQILLTFMDAILLKDPLALKILEEGKYLIPTEHKHDYMGYELQKGGFCKRIQKQGDNLLYD